MEVRDGDTSDTKFIDALFYGIADLYLEPSSAAVEAMEFINKVIHEYV